MPDAVGILQQGIDAIKDRAASRDTETERSMAKTVQLFNTLYGKDLTESQGWMFMTLLKMVRASQGAFRLDDYVDMGPYCAFAGEAAGKETQLELERAKSKIDESMTTTAMPAFSSALIGEKQTIDISASRLFSEI